MYRSYQSWIVDRGWHLFQKNPGIPLHSPARIWKPILSPEFNHFHELKKKTQWCVYNTFSSGFNLRRQRREFFPLVHKEYSSCVFLIQVQPRLSHIKHIEDDLICWWHLHKHIVWWSSVLPLEFPWLAEVFYFFFARQMTHRILRALIYVLPIRRAETGPFLMDSDSWRPVTSYSSTERLMFLQFSVKSHFLHLDRQHLLWSEEVAENTRFECCHYDKIDTQSLKPQLFSNLPIMFPNRSVATLVVSCYWV